MAEQDATEGTADTRKMLMCAYPNGVPHEERFALFFVVGREMSHRQAASALAEFLKEDNAEVLNELYQVFSATPPDDADVFRVEGRLQPCGYPAWRAG